MGPLAALSAGFKIGTALKSFFGAGKKEPTVQDNILAQAEAARLAADKYGFNPLTMLQHGNPAGTGLSSGGVPPLASVELLTSGLKDLSDELTGEAQRRRQIEQFNFDLAKLRLDQARSGVVSVSPAASAGGAFTGRPAFVAQAASVPVYSAPAKFSLGGANVGSRPESLAGDQSDLLLPGQSLPLARVDRPLPRPAYISDKQSIASSQGRHDVPDDKLDRGKGIFVGGKYFQPPPGWSSGSVIEDEFGDSEVTNFFYSLAYGGAYAWHNLKRAGADYNARKHAKAGIPTFKVDGKLYGLQPALKEPSRSRRIFDEYGSHTYDFQKSKMFPKK